MAVPDPGSTAKWVRSVSVLLTLTLVLGLLNWAQTVLIPIATAVLLAFALSPLVNIIQRSGLRRMPAVLLVVTGAAVFGGGMGWMVTAQLSDFAAQLPNYRENIKRKLTDLHEFSRGGSFEKITNTFRELEEEIEKSDKAAPAKKTDIAMPVRVIESKKKDDLSGIGEMFHTIAPVLGQLGTAGLIIGLATMMLIQREDLRNRLIALFGDGRLTVTTKAMDDAGQRISRYLLRQLICNIIFGVAVGIGLFIIGIPYSLLWGVFAGVLRYVPYFGPLIAAFPPLAIALVISPGWQEPISVVALFLTLGLLSNMVMEPLLYGRHTGVSQPALVVAVAFWTWMWGFMGMILATPMTVCLVVIGRHVPSLNFFSVLLGDKPVLEPSINFYQRLLAKDEDEASDIAEDEFKASSLIHVCDKLLIPALTYAWRDLESDNITEGHHRTILKMIGKISEELAEAEPILHSPVPEAPRVLILTNPARDEADALALQMFSRLLDPNRCDIRTTTTAILVSELMIRIEELNPAVLVISSLPPGGLAQTRYICLKLRAKFPKLRVIVGRWGLKENQEKNLEQLKSAGVAHIGTTLAESIEQITEIVKFLAVASEAVVREDGKPVA